MYAVEIARVLSVMPDGLVVDAVHFGSTAIPGMLAKPVIDILVVVHSLHAARANAVAPLEGLSYSYWAKNPKLDRMFFVRGLPPALERTHHLHLTEPGGDLWSRVSFRDYLRAHPEEAARYAALKTDLAERHRTDREAYTEGKSDYVKEILAKV